MVVQNVNLRYVIHTATAIGRAFGRERAGLIDVLQALADVRGPAGVCLRSVGLTEQAIVSWRRAHGIGSLQPLLAADEVTPTPDVERLLAAVLEHGPVLHIDVARGWLGAELVSRRDTDESDLASLLDFFDVDRSRLGVELARSADGSASLPFPRRAHPGLNIYRQVEHLVFVPYAPSPNGGNRHLNTLAEHSALNLHVDELGARVHAALASYGRAEDPAAAPYWEKLGYKSESLFLRRSRLVMATQRDYFVMFYATRHLGRLRYETRSDVTGVCAPIDDASSIGDAVLTAIQVSKG